MRQRVFVAFATILLIGVGIWSALRLPIDAQPDITNVQVQVNTAVPALAPEEIEKIVTTPIENELAGIPGMTELRSLSKFGLSQVTLVFDDGTDLYRARQLVSERLQPSPTNCRLALRRGSRRSPPGSGRFSTMSWTTRPTPRPSPPHGQNS